MTFPEIKPDISDVSASKMFGWCPIPTESKGANKSGETRKKRA